ncbi:hypothetical protein GO986_02095 [Deinococcus sp. HMF7620]|uniref:Uncharacterized protein n=1 Tax=Deinococcus arboris TaxID=2682977 RepID=A0A7C9HPK4_9DEIO|nr:hypothetical protein [Deinococcus arboris]MVN85552.1 hypothetical protein [Deinococcus arboris]
MKVQTVATCQALNTYLRRATWGLPAPRRQELWDELEEHALTRAAQLGLHGFSSQDALTQAIRELGPPVRVGLGMAKVYAMPKLLLAAGTLAVALSAALYALAGGRDAVSLLPVLTQRPAKPTCVRGTVPTSPHIAVVSQQGNVTCYTFNQPGAYGGVFLSGTDLQRAITAQGGQVTLQNGHLTLSLPGQTTGGGSVSAFFSKDGVAYYDAASVVRSLRTPRPITLQGFRAPQLRVSGLTLQFGAPGTELGRAFYNPLGLDLAARLLRSGQAAVPVDPLPGEWVAAAPGQTSTGPLHAVQTGLPKGEVVMLMTKRDGQNYAVDTAEVQAGGLVQLQSHAATLRFVKDPGQLGPFASGGAVPGLLVRVSGVPLDRLASGIFLPAQATSTAR